MTKDTADADSGQTFNLLLHVSGVREWLTRSVQDENLFLLLLGVRWFSLVPPAVAIWLRPTSATHSIRTFMVAVAINLLLSTFYPRLNRLVQRQPLLLGLDMLSVAIFIAVTGGTTSPYILYARTPLLAAAFFFYVRGGLIASLCFTPLYIVAVYIAKEWKGIQPDVVQAIVQMFSIFLITLAFGYLSLLLQRVRVAAVDLRSTQAELARAETLAALGKLVGYLSHEIRNPLSTMGGFAHQLLRKSDNPELVRHHAQIIVDEAKHLEELLTHALSLARPPKPVPHLLNVHDILDRACLLASGEMQKAAPITIEKRYEPHLPRIVANESSLIRAFLNVIRNAIEFMPQGGTITISTRSTEREVEIAITDTGPGIAADVLPTIFQPFVTHREHGTGLGLSVTQQVIEEHGGHIQVQTEEGKGTCFIFRLPIMQPEQQNT